ncbi:MAG: thioredoxin family protein [Marinirhabdus sp.]
MKPLLFFALFTIAATTAPAQKINWMTMNDALAAQQKNPKKILMDVYTTWCGPCKLLDKNTFSNLDVIKYINANYYAVKFNAEGTEEINYKEFNYTNPNHRPGRRGRNATHFFADALKLRGYPSLVFFEEDGALIQALPGYKTPEQLEIFLKMIANNDHKKLKTTSAWEKYQNNFKGTFKNTL